MNGKDKMESCVDNFCRQSWIIDASCWTWIGTTSKVKQYWVIMDLWLFLNYWS